MNIDDYEKIPCSREDWGRLNRCNLRVEDAEGNTSYFKLVPKEKTNTYCPGCTGQTLMHYVGNNAPKAELCGNCANKKKSDRFASIDALIDEKYAYFEQSPITWSSKKIINFDKRFAREIVAIIEEAK